jgi:curved DNA binding protein
MEKTTDKANQEETLQTPGVMIKYKTAGEIAQKVLNELITKCEVGASIHTLCKLGNQRINEECAKVFNNKKVPKGVAFPVCISPNEISGHFSPLGDEDISLKNGDMIKIDLGVHIDGFSVVLAHTVFVGEERDELKVKTASAAYHGLVNLLKMLKIGNTNKQCTNVVEKVVKSMGVSPMEGVLSHQIGKFVVDGKNVIINNSNPEHKVSTFTLEKDQVFGIDVIVSANETEGKSKESELRTTVFKRSADVHVDLKTKNSRQFLGEVINRFHDMPFSLVDFEDPLKARVGLSECVKQNHVQPFQILVEKSKAPVAQFKWTVAISKKKLIIFGAHQTLNFELAKLNPVQDPEVQTIVDTPLEELSKNKK